MDKREKVSQEKMLQSVARIAATRLAPIEVHAICVLLSMAFGRGTIQSRIFAGHVNAVRRSFGLPEITQAAAGNPILQEKMDILRSALEKLGEEGQAMLISVLLHSPMYQSVQPCAGQEEGKPP